MRHCIFLILFCLLVGTPILSHAACPDGERRCEALKSNEADYNRCMDLVCDVPAVEETPVYEEKKLAGTDTCDNGLRRCAPLRDKLVAYWACMEDTCTSPEFSLEEKKADCDKGKQVCGYRQQEWRVCVNIACNNKRGVFKECEKSKEFCQEIIDDYWNCVTKECLGDVTEYLERDRQSLDPEKNKFDRRIFEHMGTEKKIRYDENGQVIMPLLGAPEEYAYAPGGVDQTSYRFKNSPDRLLPGPPSDYLQCASMADGKPVRLICSGNDVNNCMCSNGKIPTYRDNSFEARNKRFEQQREADAERQRQDDEERAEKYRQVMSGRINFADPKVLERVLSQLKSGRPITNPFETDADKERYKQEYLEREKRRMGLE